MAPSKICGDSDVEDLLKELYKVKEIYLRESGEGIIGSNLTPDDIVHESSNNELQECDKAVEENNDVIENDIVVGGGQIIPYQHYDMFMGNVAQCNREASQNSGKHGSNLKVGQHFVSKDELSYYLSIIAINGRFEMRTTKSNKSIKEVRYVSENCSWRVRATKMKDSHFFVIRQYHSLHSCSLMNRNANHRQASSRVIEPPEDKTIGRPRTNRIPSKGEFLKKQYNCGACGQSGHNSQTCPQVPSDGRSTTHV
ncbi:hypothetical protein G4B88_015313 [Cannabis sativa]|uniref:CCHC-type domain-containing protein n=1 Tax=Cannabis sativa TaxID=3483 RepID=A0A7J6EFM7_CANSA|nr:hypothetical protein G4B88_015313 [Cannabis sativa]